MVVQIVGDQNHVCVSCGGKPLFSLVHSVHKLRQAQTLAIPTLRLLNTFMRESTFVGRTDQIQNFIGWLESKPAFSVRTIIGPAGAGKTRFALELMEAIHADPFDPGGGPRTEGWVGGFIEGTAEEPQLPPGSLVLPRPLLVVVDYAASMRRGLRAWLKGLAMALSGQSRPLRVLLLERHGTPDAGWLKDLLGFVGHSDVGLAGWFHPPEPISMKPLASVHDRAQVFEQMVGKFAALAKTSPVSSPKDIHTLLEPPTWGNPLHLIMAAAVAAERGTALALSMSHTELAQYLAKREVHHIRQDPQGGLGQDNPLPVYLAACATLAKGLDREEALACSQLILDLTGCQYPDGKTGLARATSVLLVGQTGESGIAPVSPDIVAEAFIYHALTCDEWTLAPKDIPRGIYQVCKQVGPNRSQREGPGSGRH